MCIGVIMDDARFNKSTVRTLTEQLSQVIREGRASKELLNSAVELARMYHGMKPLRSRTRDLQKIYTRLIAKVKTIASKEGMDLSDVLDQINQQAIKLGSILPTPGKDM